jgi:hypothetical protein
MAKKERVSHLKKAAARNLQQKRQAKKAEKARKAAEA